MNREKLERLLRLSRNNQETQRLREEAIEREAYYEEMVSRPRPDVSKVFRLQLDP